MNRKVAVKRQRKSSMEINKIRPLRKQFMLVAKLKNSTFPNVLQLMLLRCTIQLDKLMNSGYDSMNIKL